MITIACSACQKKLSIKEELLGKQVMCPVCGRLTLVPVTVALGGDEPRAVPAAALASPPAGAENPPTNPPLDIPDQTMAVKAESEDDSSLTDFLAPPQAKDELGRLGRYRILKVLGHGGMGAVYLGEDPALSRKVAIKVMLPHLAKSKSSQQRFMREARVAASLEHDHIVPIFHVDSDRGAPYIVMPFLKGEPLDDTLRRTPHFELSEILRIGREIAEGLAAAHAIGLIHRDIKPANIWLETTAARGLALAESTASAKPQADSRVRILDFGLARASSGDDGVTQEGAIVGTPAYMAPEQGRGERVDARCDLFSLGVVLYRMCTGRTPFQGNDAVSTLLAVASVHPAPPIELNPALPKELSDLVMKLLEKDRNKRVATAGEVVQALQAIEKKTSEKTVAIAMPVLPKASVDRTLFAVDDSLPTITKAVQAPTLTLPALPALPGRRIMIKIALGIGLALLLILAGGISHHLLTNHGIVRVEVNDPDIKIVFDADGPTISGVDKQDIQLSPGQHVLHVERGKLKFDTGKFQLKRGDQISLKVEWLANGRLQALLGERLLGSKRAEKPAPPEPPPAFALRFSGGDVVVLPVQPDVSGPYTVEAYATVEGPPVRPVGGTITVAGFRSGIILAVRGDGKGWSFNVPSLVEQTKRLHSATPITNEQTHVAAVRSGKNYRLFVNGKLVESLDYDQRVGDTGRLPSNSIGGKFQGLIGEVRISKGARYDKDFTPQKRFEPDKDTLALYHMDEGAGDELKDSSGNGHHGKIVGAKWVKVEGTQLSAGGATIDLLPLIDPTKEGVRGEWQRTTSGELRGTAPAAAITRIPYRPPAEYDLRVEFTPAEGSGVSEILVGGGKQFSHGIGWDKNTKVGIGLVDGKLGTQNATTVLKKAWLEKDRRHVSLVQVRKNRVSAYLDGALVTELKTDFANVSLNPGSDLTDRSVLGIAAFEGSILFHRVEVTEISSPGTFTRPDDPAAKKAAEQRLAPRAITLDLLPLIDPAKDGVHGEWKFNNAGELLAEGIADTRLGIPYQPPAEYDLRVRFTRTSGDNVLMQLLVVGGQQFAWLIGPRAGFEIEKFGRTGVGIEKADWLTNQRVHESLVQVRRDGVQCFLDGAAMTQKVPFAGLTAAPSRSLPNKTILGLGAYSPIVFHRVDITEIGGSGTFTRPDDPAAKKAAEQRKIGAVPGPWRPLLTAAGSPPPGWSTIGGPRFDAVSEKGELILHASGEGALYPSTGVVPEKNYRLRLEYRWPNDTAIWFRLKYHDKGGQGINCVIERLGPGRCHASSTTDYAAEPGEIQGGKVVSSGPPRKLSQTPISYPEKLQRPSGEWNTFELICLGDRSIQIDNGKVAAVLVNQRLKSVGSAEVPVTEGAFGLWAQQGAVEFRKIEIQEIDVLPPELFAPGPWQSLFNGKDLTGWQALTGQPPLTESWAVAQEDGAPVLQALKGGSAPISKDTFSDFHLRLDFKRSDPDEHLFVQFNLTSDGSGMGVSLPGKNGFISSWLATFDEGELKGGKVVFKKAAPTTAGKPAQSAHRYLPVTPRVREAGAWNRLEIVRLGDACVCFLNNEILGVITNYRIVKDGMAPEILANSRLVFGSSRGKILIRNFEIRAITALPPEVLEKAAWRPLFNGKDLTGWTPKNGQWKVEGEEIVGAPTDTVNYQALNWSGTARDFEVSFEARSLGASSSLRFRRAGTQGAVQIGPSAGWLSALDRDGKYVSLAVSAAAAVKSARPEDFNHYLIRVVGNHVTVTVNGVLASSGEYSILEAEGTFTWSMAPMCTELRLRNVRFTDLSNPAPPPQ